jgi:tetratricopeptide (TPR) repeat protein
LNRKHGLAEAINVNNELGKRKMIGVFAGILIAFMALSICVIAEKNTAGDWIEKGCDQIENGSLEEALADFDKAIQIDPNNRLGWINEAYVLDELNRTFESSQASYKALEITDMMLEADSRNATLWLEKGFLLTNVGNEEEAVNAFDNASKIDPKNVMAWRMKGILLAGGLQRYDDALRTYDAALNINPDDSTLWALKGETLKTMGRQAEADDAYAKAREMGYQE